MEIVMGFVWRIKVCHQTWVRLWAEINGVDDLMEKFDGFDGKN